MFKLIYLAKRKPGFTRDEFTRRWRRHGALGMSMDMWRNTLAYAQAEPIQPPPIAGACGEYDAVVYLMFKDEAYLGPPPTEQDVADGQALLRDELETFSRNIYETYMYVDEETLKPGDLGGVTAFLYFLDGAAGRTAAERYRSHDKLTRVVLNTRRDPKAPGERISSLPYEAVVELAAAQLADLRSVLEPEAERAWRAAEVAVIAREAVLWDRVSPCA
jgi:hypothetical protein